MTGGASMPFLEHDTLQVPVSWLVECISLSRSISIIILVLLL